MTKKLEELFDLPSTGLPTEETPADILPLVSTIEQIDEQIDKIDAAMPAIKDLDTLDKDFDELSDLAKQSFNDLSDLGMQVDSRYASEIFSVAGQMLSHAISAKTAKMQKKLRTIDLQLRKAKLDLDVAKNQGPGESDSEGAVTSQGFVLDRNELLRQLVEQSRNDNEDK